MATVVAKRRLVNPAGKRRRNMSPKQIKFFGTPQQKAALQRKRSAGAKKSAAVRKRTVRANGRKVRAKVSRPVRRKNAGEIVIAGLAGNPAPAKRSTSMRTTKKKKTRSRSRARTHANASSPRRRKRNSSHRPRRRYGNPSRSGGSIMTLAKKGAAVVGGGFGTRFLTQLALGARNTGAVGYAVNAAIAFGLGYGTKKILRDESLGDLVTAGGFGAIVLRAVQDFTPFGEALNSQLRGVGDVGVYGATTFFVPLQEAPGPERGQPMLPGAMNRPAPAPAPAPAGASGVGRYGRGGRYS